MENFSNNHIITSKSMYVDKSGFKLYNGIIMYQQVTPKTIENTTTTTSIFDDTNCVGTRTIPADFLQAGNIIEIDTLCDLSNTGNPTNRMSLDFGNKNLFESEATLGAQNSNSLARLYIKILITKIGEDGTCVFGGYTQIFGASDVSRKLISSTPLKINTSKTQEIKLNYKWGTADSSNILKVFSSTIKISNYI